jgi:glycosyltransferase involved in cell wall biosynthesis
MLELGGAQQNTLHTVTHLDRSRFVPELITGPGGLLDREARLVPDLAVTFVPELVRPVSPARDARALLALARTFRRTAPDIVHTHSSKAGILGRWAARLARVPVVVHTIHGYGFHAEQGPVPYRVFRGLESATARITTRFVAVSRADLTAGIERRLFPRQKAVLIRSGIPLREFGMVSDRRLRRELGVPPAAPLVGMVACLKPQKAPVDFVRMADAVRHRVPAAHFVLVGDGALRPAVEAEAARLGLGAQLHLLGWRRDVPAILGALDVFALTSLWEGLPRAIPEAMASGLPVVATRVDGIPEAVTDGVTGYLAAPHDVETLADRVVFLLEHPSEARRMGEEGRSRVGEFDIDDMVRRQEDLYHELAGTLASACASARGA